MSVEVYTQPSPWTPPILPESISGLPPKESKHKSPVIPIHTIDGSNAHEIDDGFNQEQINDHLFVVHTGLANAATLIHPGSEGFDRAFSMVHTHYGSHFRSMIDPSLINRYLNLQPGQIRPAIIISYSVNLNTLGSELLSVQSGAVKSKQQWTYGQVDRIITNPDCQDRDAIMFKQARNVALALTARRRFGTRAYFVDYESATIHFTSGKTKTLPYFNTYPSRFIVESQMINSSSLSDKFTIANFIPFLHRVCSPYKNDNRAYYSPNPGEHAGLGLDNYTHLTSQLRRFADLVNGLQINAFLEHQDSPDYPFSFHDLEIIADHINNYSYQTSL